MSFTSRASCRRGACVEKVARLLDAAPGLKYKAALSRSSRRRSFGFRPLESQRREVRRPASRSTRKIRRSLSMSETLSETARLTHVGERRALNRQSTVRAERRGICSRQNGNVATWVSSIG
jgi:hypothetical protein